MKRNRGIDDLLKRHFDAAGTGNEAAVERVLVALTRPLPRQRGKLMSRLPELLLDWQFAPAWPRVAALACCAALGLMIGFSGIDRSIDGLSTAEAATAPSFASAVFEPEPLTGIRP